MFIYNVTIKVKQEIAQAWLIWLKDEHIKEIIATGCFSDAVVMRLLEVDDSEGPTFAVQYKAFDRAAYELYIEQHAGLLRQKSYEKWGDGFIAIRTIMEVVN